MGLLAGAPGKAQRLGTSFRGNPSLIRARSISLQETLNTHDAQCETADTRKVWSKSEVSLLKRVALNSTESRVIRPMFFSNSHPNKALATKFHYQLKSLLILSLQSFEATRQKYRHQESSSGQSPNCLRTALRQNNTALSLTNYSYTLSGRKTTTKVCLDAFCILTTDDTVSVNVATTENLKLCKTIDRKMDTQIGLMFPHWKKKRHIMFSLSPV